MLLIAIFISAWNAKGELSVSETTDVKQLWKT